MKTRMTVRPLRAIAVLTVALLCYSSWAFSEFTVVRVRGRAHVKLPKAARFESAKTGMKCPFGTTLKTGRLSSVILELSEGNQVRVMGSTTVTVVPNMANPKVVRLKVTEKARLKVSLKKFPKNAKFEIETPVGVCAAIGTVFDFTYTSALGGTHLILIDVTDGAINFTGELFSAADVAAGGSLKAVLYKSAGGWNVKFSVSGVPVDLTFGNSTVHVDANSVVNFAFGLNADGTPDTSRFATRFESGSGSVGGTAVQPATGAFIVENNTIVTGSQQEAGQMLEGTKPPPGAPVIGPVPHQDIPQSTGGIQ